MNILIIAQRCPYPPNKGEKIRTYHHLKFLREQGHAVFLAAPYEDVSELAFFSALSEDYCEKVVCNKLLSKPIRLLAGLLTGKALSVSNFYLKSLQYHIDQLLQHHSIDVIYCSASSVAEYVFKSRVIQQLNPKPRLLMDFMDVDSDKWAQYATNHRWPLNLVYQREAKLIAEFEKEIATSFDHCILITQAEVDLFEQQHKSHFGIHAIENGLDTSAFYPPLKPRARQAPKLLFAGVMDYAPNVDAVMWFIQHVWPTIIAQWPQATFCIAGMNPIDKLTKLHATNGIEITGFVDDIKPYFDQANIFVAPFRLARGVQNKVLQAFASGLPVVSTPMGAEGIKCQDQRDILLASRPEDFVECIRLLMENPQRYDTISHNALSLIEQHYAWNSVLAPLAALIAQD